MSQLGCTPLIAILFIIQRGKKGEFDDQIGRTRSTSWDNKKTKSFAIAMKISLFAIIKRKKEGEIGMQTSEERHWRQIHIICKYFSIARR